MICGVFSCLSSVVGDFHGVNSTKILTEANDLIIMANVDKESIR